MTLSQLSNNLISNNLASNNLANLLATLNARKPTAGADDWVFSGNEGLVDPDTDDVFIWHGAQYSPSRQSFLIRVLVREKSVALEVDAYHWQLRGGDEPFRRDHETCFDIGRMLIEELKEGRAPAQTVADPAVSFLAKKGLAHLSAMSKSKQPHLTMR